MREEEFSGKIGIEIERLCGDHGRRDQ